MLLDSHRPASSRSGRQENANEGLSSPFHTSSYTAFTLGEHFRESRVPADERKHLVGAGRGQAEDEAAAAVSRQTLDLGRVGRGEEDAHRDGPAARFRGEALEL